MLGNQQLPYVDPFACDWHGLGALQNDSRRNPATTDPGGNLDHYKCVDPTTGGGDSRFQGSQDARCSRWRVLTHRHHEPGFPCRHPSHYLRSIRELLHQRPAALGNDVNQELRA